MGPPIDKREILYIPTMYDHMSTITIALLLLYLAYRAWQKQKYISNLNLLLISIATVCICTSPWLAISTKYVIGAYPTIDKEGSFLFYQNGVHVRALLHPIDSLADKSVQLIGFHMGHLWINQFFDVFVSNYAVCNLQVLANLALNLYSCYLLFETQQTLYTENDSVSGHIPNSIANRRTHISWSLFIVSVCFSLQLHILRDIHWYTVEKSAMYPIFLFWREILLLEKRQTNRYLLGIYYFFATYINFYWGIVLGILGALYTIKTAIQKNKPLNLYKNMAICICIGMVIGIYQMLLQKTPFATQEEFAVRASLDIFDIVHLDWNRMGFWRAIHPLILLFAGGTVAGTLHKKIKEKSIQYNALDKKTLDMVFLLITAIIFAFLSFGPTIYGYTNPIYWLFSQLPGMWRFAKPEIFFFIPYSIMCIFALQNKYLFNKYVLCALLCSHIYTTHTSPEYPYITQFIQSTLHFAP